MAVKLFRRHSATCTKKHPKDLRVYETDTARSTKKPQCECVITAEGTTSKGVWLNQKSTRRNDWNEARLVVQGWEAEAGGSLAVEPMADQTEDQPISIFAAIQDFTKVKKANGTAGPRMAQYRAVLDTRLVPFANNRNIVYIQEADNAKFWSDFRLSWANKNPFHNRKAPKGLAVADKPLMRSTDTRMISDMRAFINHCVSREWLSEDWASRKKHGMGIATKRGRKRRRNHLLSLIYRIAIVLVNFSPMVKDGVRSASIHNMVLKRWSSFGCCVTLVFGSAMSRC